VIVFIVKSFHQYSSWNLILEPDFFLYDVTKLDKPRKGSIIGGTRIEDFVTLEVHSQQDYEAWIRLLLGH